ncbi:hypothetical protein [Zhongshania aliphaticivorans]|nr:hypothetical protein [Zhongshania aliphaticivorans]
MSRGNVDINPGYMLLDAGEAEGYYYSGCYMMEFDFTVAPLWLMERSMDIEPMPIHKPKDLYLALGNLIPKFRTLDLDELGIYGWEWE